MAGAGTVTQSIEEVTSEPKSASDGGFTIVTFSCVGDSSGGGIPDTTTEAAITERIKGCYLIKCHLITGTKAPTADSDVYIKDADGIDLLGGSGVDALDNSASTGIQLWPTVVTQYGRQPITGALVLDVDGDSVASAVYSVKLIISK